MTFRHLDGETISALRTAALQLGLVDAANRPALFDGIPGEFRFSLPLFPAPATQLTMDLSKLNEVERLVDGSVPLEQWLRNASGLAGGDKRGRAFLVALDRMSVRSSGDSHWHPPDDLPEFKEAIVHQDDRLAFGFLDRGAQAGAAVAKFTVPRHEGQQPKLRPDGSAVVYNGTAWLLGPSLVVTNHHVVEARDRGDPPASDEDFKLQGLRAEAFFGFDAEGQQGQPYTTVAVEAADRALDYAVLRLAREPGIKPLRLHLDPFTWPEGRYPAVNLIQHPGGMAKVVAIRNNLATRSTETDLRYYTDTDRGASGAPVLDDGWAVVALHRGATAAPETARFQGRSTAVVNVGTRITAIRDDVCRSRPDLWGEIARSV